MNMWWPNMTWWQAKQLAVVGELRSCCFGCGQYWSGKCFLFCKVVHLVWNEVRSSPKSYFGGFMCFMWKNPQQGALSKAKCRDNAAYEIIKWQEGSKKTVLEANVGLMMNYIASWGIKEEEKNIYKLVKMRNENKRFEWYQVHQRWRSKGVSK